jgi:hypothetical protein
MLRMDVNYLWSAMWSRYEMRKRIRFSAFAVDYVQTNY